MWEGRGFRLDAACGLRVLLFQCRSHAFVHGAGLWDYPLAVLCTWSKVEGKEESSVIGGGGSPCITTQWHTTYNGQRPATVDTGGVRGGAAHTVDV